MQDVNIDRLCLAVRSRILHCMKKALHQPTTEELYALELKARRLRAEETARWFRAGIGRVRNLFRVVNVKGLKHA